MPLCVVSCFDFPCFTSLVSGIIALLSNLPSILPGLLEIFSHDFAGSNSMCCSWMPPLNPTPSPEETILPDGSIQPPTGGGVLSFFEGIPSEAKVLIGIVVAILIGYGISRLIKGKKPPIEGGGE